MFTIPNMRHLRAFEAVARLGSVGQASLHVHVTQPAVTQAIAKLEAQMGAKLFDRRPSGSYLTECGAILERRVARFFSMIEESLVAASASSATDPGQRVALLNTVTSTQIRSLALAVDPMAAATAAGEMDVSEATLYRSARGLEHILGSRLFQPSANGVVSTPLGQELARKLRLAIREIDYALREIRAAQRQATAQLTLGVLPMSGSFALARAINALTGEHPWCRVKVIEGPYLTLLKSLRAGEVDMFFGMVRKPDWANDVTELPLFQDDFCIVVRHNHPLTRARAVGKADLMKYEWVVPPPCTPRRRALDGYFASDKPPETFGVETSSTSVIRALVANSDRISVLSRHEVESESSNLFAILPTTIAIPTTKGITLRTDWLPTDLQSEFIALLRLHTSGADAGPMPLAAVGG